MPCLQVKNPVYLVAAADALMVRLTFRVEACILDDLMLVSEQVIEQCKTRDQGSAA